MSDFGNCVLIVNPVGRRIKNNKVVPRSWWVDSWFDNHFLGVCPKIWRTLRGALNGTKKMIEAHHRLVPDWNNHVLIGDNDCIRFKKVV